MYEIHLNLKSFDYIYIKKFKPKIQFILKLLSMRLYKLISLPSKKKRYTVLTSPHIDKRSREQFEWKRNKTHFRFVCNKLAQYQLFLFLVQNLDLSGMEIEIRLRYSTFFNWRY